MNLDYLVAYYKCDDVRNWNPPAVGTEERKKWPKEAFLDQENRKYPYKYENAEGEWVTSEKALLSARRLAAVHDKAVFDKTTPLLNAIRKERGEEPLQADAIDVESNMAGTMIREITKNIADEAEAISDYTDSIAFCDDAKLKAIFAEIRNDELGHLQKLTVALTEILGGSEPEAAEAME